MAKPTTRNTESRSKRTNNVPKEIRLPCSCRTKTANAKSSVENERPHLFPQSKKTSEDRDHKSKRSLLATPALDAAFVSLYNGGRLCQQRTFDGKFLTKEKE